MQWQSQPLPILPPSLWPQYLPTPFVSLLYQFLSIGTARETDPRLRGRKNSARAQYTEALKEASCRSEATLESQVACLLCKSVLQTGNLCPYLITLWHGLDGGHFSSLPSFLLAIHQMTDLWICHIHPSISIHPSFSASILIFYISHMHKCTFCVHFLSSHPLVYPIFNLSIHLSISSSKHLIIPYGHT